ncbi:MAG: DUF374 domain-containing protein [bacterium]|jgi:lysophospholipid acyltransferase (LPLAT)-like uncharacterized protein|nr:DUF374 domain-containing protein [candidate division KSB1 bacterium]MDH7560050.1 DUF374 domain-containing protein [bacterium]
MPFRQRLKNIRRRISYSRVFVEALAFCGFAAMKLLTSTLRVRLYIHPSVQEQLHRGPLLFAFWHGRQFLLVPHFPSWNIALMSDLSWAGDIQTRILQRFGYTVVRGSSSHGGMRALLTLKKAIEAGHPAAFAVDGPRGPAFHAKPGILFLAEKLGLPLAPVATSAKPAWTLESTWCRYLLPKPFARCVAVLGKPIPPRSLAAQATTAELDRILNELTVRADLLVGATYHQASLRTTA